MNNISHSKTYINRCIILGYYRLNYILEFLWLIILGTNEKYIVRLDSLNLIHTGRFIHF